jgi:glycosyltransferase involved in cell wall biosynthesis
MSTTSCIIPFYNEGERILHVLTTLQKCKSISEILCVDDGSTDGNSEKIRRIVPNVRVIQLKQNQGKAFAISEGFRNSHGTNILLFDADLTRINVIQLETAIRFFCTHQTIDMIILRKTPDPWYIIRTDIVISGQRLVRKNDLTQILNTHPNRFTIELAINNYMLTHHKTVGWLPLTCQDLYKREKYGLLQGSVRELAMYKDVLSFRNPLWYAWHLASFCRAQVNEIR